MDNQRINAASQQILEACLSGDDPVVTLYGELDRLRRDGHWTELEIRRLQIILLDTAKMIASNRQQELPTFSDVATCNTARNEAEISQTIQDCIKKCLKHEKPLVCLAACISDLDAAGWAYDDVKAVENGALRVLATTKADGSF